MGVLKARVGSSWQAIGTGVGEVFVGPNDPGTNVGIELWYDSDDNSVIAASTVGYEANRPAATPANAGLHYFATDTLREWLCDGTGWIIMFEPPQFFVTTLGAGAGVITTVGALSFNYRRRNGSIEWDADFNITTNGTAATYLTFVLPFAPAAQMIIGSGKEDNINGMTVMSRSVGSSTSALFTGYNNNYPGANGTRFLLSGSYRMASRYS